MKKIRLLLLLLCMSAALYASPAFGYSMALRGETTPVDSFGALEFDALFSAFPSRHIGDVEVDMVVGFDAPAFKGVDISVSSPLFYSMKNPMERLFSNRIWWAPKVSGGVQYRTEEGWRMMAGLSPMNFIDVDFTYEFFSPYFTYDAEKNFGWGVRIIKFTAFLGGN